MRRFATTLVLAITWSLWSSGPSKAGPISLPDGHTLQHIDFERHVQALLDRQGCNAGKCHGHHNAAGSFSLSLMAAAPDKDHEEITRSSLGRRVTVADPDRSLFLRKATGKLQHKGGVRVVPGSWEYQVLRQWIAEGAVHEPGRGKIKSMEVFPSEHIFAKPGETKQLTVLVTFANGDREDVTSFCDFRIPDEEPPCVSRNGLIEAVKPGEVAVMVFYRGRMRVFRAMVAFPVAKDVAYPKVPEVNFIDREIFAQLRKLNLVPSDLCSDEQFLRRVTIDIIGTLPNPDEIRAFLASKDPHKRTKKIDQLLAHPRHASLLAAKFCDITGFLERGSDNAKTPRAKAAQMAHAWFAKRLGDNMPYDQIVEGILCATSKEGREPEVWQQEKLALEDSATGFGTDYAKRRTLDHYWRHGERTGADYLESMAERTATAFLGVRLKCARCHDHPLDGWSVADHRGFASIFSQVRMERVLVNPKRFSSWDDAAFAREIFLGYIPGEQVRHPDTESVMRPRLLGGPEIDFHTDARVTLVRWLVRPDNPFFARHFVNCMWEHYFGRSLVEATDRYTSAYPAAQKTLLDLLARDFVESKFDIRRLERTMLLSRTYQLSANPTENNKLDQWFYSRIIPRRLSPRVAADVLHSALETNEEFGPKVPAGQTAIDVMHEGPFVSILSPRDGYQQRIDRLVREFGRKDLVSRCESEASLASYVHLLHSGPVNDALKRSKRIHRLGASTKPLDEVLDDCFLAVLSRLPTMDQRKHVADHLDKNPKKPRQELVSDLFWALVNTREFLLRH